LVLSYSAIDFFRSLYSAQLKKHSCRVAEVLLGLGDVADHQVGLADVLVRALVLGIQAQASL
jgi:hypothetical protein